MIRFIIIGVFLLPLSLLGSLSTSSDSVKSLFKTPKITHVQWDLGYTGGLIKGQQINAWDISLIGLVFNGNWYLSAGINGWVSSQQNFLTTLPPQLDSYVLVFLNNEYLLKPNNVLNFSFPIKISYGGATGWDTIFRAGHTQMVSNWNFTGRNYYQHYGTFWNVSTGANALVNLFRGLSLGVGGHYRLAFNVSEKIGTSGQFSNFHVNAFMRIKFDTKLYMERARERQRNFYKNLGGN
jgi:hypothetical protein